MSDKYSGWPAPAGDRKVQPAEHSRATSVENMLKADALATADETPNADLEALRKEAVDLGIDVDQRWGARRLKREIENARANDSA